MRGWPQPDPAENFQDVEIVTRRGVRPLEPERDRMGLDRREVEDGGQQVGEAAERKERKPGVGRQETRDGDNGSGVGLTC